MYKETLSKKTGGRGNGMNGASSGGGASNDDENECVLYNGNLYVIRNRRHTVNIKTGSEEKKDTKRRPGERSLGARDRRSEIIEENI